MNNPKTTPTFSKSHHVPCPSCSEQILVDLNLLITGRQFGCKNCGSSISLAIESREVVKKSLVAFEQLRKTVPGKK